jgi:hypothetical protein
MVNRKWGAVDFSWDSDSGVELLWDRQVVGPDVGPRVGPVGTLVGPIVDLAVSSEDCRDLSLWTSCRT